MQEYIVCSVLLSSVFNNVYISDPKLDHRVLGEKDVYVKFVSVSTPCTHAWTPENSRLIVIILQCNADHKNVFLHIQDVNNISRKFNLCDF
jgi:hypothetical protein